jgi:uncharacterized membrane protein
MKSALNWVLARLSEKSTWLAVVTFLGTALGIKLAPELSDAITTVGLAVTSLALVVLRETPKK